MVTRSTVKYSIASADGSAPPQGLVKFNAFFRDVDLKKPSQTAITTNTTDVAAETIQD